MLYIIRHGQTAWNVQRRLQGQTDIPLNETGRAMAEKAREEYRDIHFDICFSSPLARARETAEILLEGTGVPVVTDRRLAEMCFGEYEGQNIDAQPEDSPITAFFHAPERYVPARGAESFEQLFARTGQFLAEVAEPLLRQDKDVLIAGHIAMNPSIICRIRDIPLERFWTAGTDNCRLVRLILNSGKTAKSCTCL